LSINNLIADEQNNTWLSKVIPLSSLSGDVLTLNTFDLSALLPETRPQ
jgi:hypothetical protein